MFGIDASVWAVAANVATVFGVLAAFVAALGAWLQIRSQRAAQLESNAKQIWSTFLRLAFDYPEYAEPKSPIHLDPSHAAKYTWFVSNLMNSLDEVLAMAPQPYWRTTAKLMIGIHKEYLKTDEFQSTEAPTLSSELRHLIKQGLKSAA
jgi:hypothetical protein